MTDHSGKIAFIIICYFVFITIILGLLGGSGVLQDTSIYYEENDNLGSGTALNQSASTIIPASTNPWDIGDGLSVITGFYTFDLYLGIGNFEYIIKILFVWLPLVALGIAVVSFIRGL